MNIRILLTLLALSLLLAFTRRWRSVGLAASGVLVVLLIWFIVQQPVTNKELATVTGNRSSSVVQTSRIAPEVVLQLDGNGAPWRLLGTIINPSDALIRSITLTVQRLDCPSADSMDTDCDVVWQGQHTLRVNIAAAKSTKVDDSFYSHEPVPRLKGVPRDRITVTGVQ